MNRSSGVFLFAKMLSTDTLQNTSHFSTGIKVFFFFKWRKDKFFSGWQNQTSSSFGP